MSDPTPSIDDPMEQRAELVMLLCLPIAMRSTSPSDDLNVAMDVASKLVLPMPIELVRHLSASPKSKVILMLQQTVAVLSHEIRKVPTP